MKAFDSRGMSIFRLVISFMVNNALKLFKYFYDKMHPKISSKITQNP